jgi:hypothetical protein
MAYYGRDAGGGRYGIVLDFFNCTWKQKGSSASTDEKNVGCTTTQLIEIVPHSATLDRNLPIPALLKHSMAVLIILTSPHDWKLDSEHERFSIF